MQNLSQSVRTNVYRQWHICFMPCTDDYSLGKETVLSHTKQSMHKPTNRNAHENLTLKYIHRKLKSQRKKH